MSKSWDVNSLRKIAGLPLMEAWDRDDDYDDEEDRDVKIAASDRRQDAFEKKNKKEIDAAPPAKKAAPAAAKKEEKAESEGSEAKSEEAKEAKRRGAKPNENSKAQRAIAWIKKNPYGTRGQFLAYARDNLEMGTAYGSAFFARHNPKSGRSAPPTVEAWVLVHPSLPSHLLSENRQQNQMQWIDATSESDPIVFESKAEAERVAQYMTEWKNQKAIVQHIIFE